jgi:hypothetical protein
MNEEQDGPSGPNEPNDPCDYTEIFLENRKRRKKPTPPKPKTPRKPMVIPEDGEIRFTFGKYIGQRVEDILDNDPEYIHWVREKAYSEPLSSYIKNLIDYDIEEYDRLRAMAAPSMTSEEILFQRALQHKLKYKTFNLERYFEWLKAASNRAKGWLAVKEFSESTRRMRWEAWAQHPDNPKNVGLDQPPVPYSGTHEAPLNPDPGSMTGSTRQMPPD